MSTTTTRPDTASPNGRTRHTRGRDATSGGVSQGATTMRLSGGRKTPPAMIALCLLLMLGCGAGAGALVLSADERITVVAAARPLAAGTVIGEADLRAAELAGSGLAAIPADRAGTLLGKTLVGPVPQGTLLNAEMFAKEPPPRVGGVAVGLALTPGQLPAQQLAPGRFVTIYQLPPKDAAAAAGPGRVLVPRAEVLSVNPVSSGGYQVTVVVDGPAAAGVSASGAAGQVALGLLPIGQG